MTDRLSKEQTTRICDWPKVSMPSLQIALRVNGQTTRKASPRDYGWMPISHQVASGITPSTWTFRVAFLPSWLTGLASRMPAEIVHLTSVLDLPRPTGTIERDYHPMLENGRPVAEEDLELLRSENCRHIDERTYPSLDIWETDNRGELFMGRFWLSNISQQGHDNLLLTFSDSRFLNYSPILRGAWYFHETSRGWELAYSLFSDISINTGGEGNQSRGRQAARREKYKYSFDEPWKGSGPEYQRQSARWTLWELLQYLWVEHDDKASIIQLIARPSIHDHDWWLWNNYGGNKTIELDISDRSPVEAIDTIVRAAGDYGWTLQQVAPHPYPMRLRVFEYRHWANQNGVTRYQSRVLSAMPARYVYIPARKSALLTEPVNCQDLTIDEPGSEYVSRVVVSGGPLVVESTFSTDGYSDYSCTYENAAAPSGVASMEWIGDLAAWQVTYVTTTGSDTDKTRAAESVDDVAYKVCALKAKVTSTSNSMNGYGFAPRSSSWRWQRRRFLPYRIQSPSPTVSKLGDEHLSPELLIWVRKPGSSEWISVGDPRFPAQVAVDPAIGGLRFSKPMVVVDTSGAFPEFTPYDVCVVAAVELDERPCYAIKRKDWNGRSLFVEELDLTFARRWNVLRADRAPQTVSEVVYDRRDDLEKRADEEFSKHARHKLAAKFRIPWVERIYEVGDYVGGIVAGSSHIYSENPIATRTVEAPVVGLQVNFGQPAHTVVITENWRR